MGRDGENGRCAYTKFMCAILARRRRFFEIASTSTLHPGRLGYARRYTGFTEHDHARTPSSRVPSARMHWICRYNLSAASRRRRLKRFRSVPEEVDRGIGVGNTGGGPWIQSLVVMLVYEIY